jgi:hypothetical protein
MNADEYRAALKQQNDALDEISAELNRIKGELDVHERESKSLKDSIEKMLNRIYFKTGVLVGLGGALAAWGAYKGILMAWVQAN